MNQSPSHDRKPQPLVVPYLRDNLENLNKVALSYRSTSILTLNAEADIKDHSAIIQDSLDVLHDLLFEYVNRDITELAIQYLVIRPFNAGVVALELSLCGYYQAAAMMLRDVLETGFLLDYFSFNQPKVKEWESCTDARDRMAKFGPRVIRDALDIRDSETNKWREKRYGIICEHASHPTYGARKLLTSSKGGEMGPFFEARFLRDIIIELAMNLPPFVQASLANFRQLPPTFIKKASTFDQALSAWRDNYGDPRRTV